MPRLSGISLAALDDLATQLRYAPASQILTQIARAVDLAATIDPDQLYPEDWLVHRLTGYRPETDSPPLFVGVAVRRDLSAFVERISDRAALTADALTPALTIDELAARWSVSRKTIERYRRSGLIAARVRSGSRTRLRFPVASVESFERNHAGTLGSAADRSRIPEPRRRSIIRIAERASRRFGWSLNETAARIAAREERSHETIRQILINSGRGRPSIGPDDRRRRVIARALRAGVSVDRLARRYNKSPQTIRRIALEERAAAVARAAQEFQTPAIAEGSALDHPAARNDLRPDIERTSGEWASIAHSTRPPIRHAEVALARAIAVLLARARRAVEPNDRPTLTSVDRAETDLRWASLLVIKLIASQRGFILAAVEARLGRSVLELPSATVRAVHRAAMDAAVDAARRFLAAPAGSQRRLAGVVGPAVDRAVASLALDRTSPGVANRAKNTGASLYDWSRHPTPWSALCDPPVETGSKQLYDFDDPLRPRAIAARFGRDGGPPRSIGEIAATLGVSTRRIERALLESRSRPAQHPFVPPPERTEDR